MEAVRAAAALPAPELRAALERARDGDPSLKVREAARLALAARAHPDLREPVLAPDAGAIDLDVGARVREQRLPRHVRRRGGGSVRDGGDQAARGEEHHGR